MKNSGENVLRFGSLSTDNNSRICFYGAPFAWFGKCVKIRLAEPVVSGLEQIFKSLAAIMLVNIVVKLAERAPAAVLEVENDLHMGRLDGGE